MLRVLQLIEVLEPVHSDIAWVGTSDHARETGWVGNHKGVVVDRKANELVTPLRTHSPKPAILTERVYLMIR